jgi:uncharacterized repeat protein (TIGR03803 family)
MMMTRVLSPRQLSGWRNICFLFLLCLAATITLPAQTFTNLVTFNSTDGSSPDDSLMQGVDGNLYGTTLGGGTSFPVAGGTAFKMTTAGNLTTLYNFCSSSIGCSDGYAPVAGLTLGADGNFYGTTSTGGTGACDESSRCGTIFKLSSDGVLTTLYSFCSQNQQQCSDGYNPLGSLVQGVNGAFYGTTSSASTIFEITPAGVFTILHNFNGTDGSDSQSGLVLGKDGSFYGTSTLGGVPNCTTFGCGTIYKISPTGKFTVLYSFCAQGGNPCPDGEYPVGGLVQGRDGNFYGTTSNGGANTSGGTVFKITPSGTLATLYSFCSQTNCADGSIPMFGTLVQGTDGNFYGTTKTGGHNGCVNYDLGQRGCGTIFRITPSGKLTTLYKFCHVTGCPDGANPFGGLFQATDGNFYGTASAGGAADCFGSTCGTVYRFSVGLGPFVSLQRPFGKVGQSVGILGQGLTGTTGVSFKGTSASFTVISNTYIRAQVPTGATTGTITVTTLSGTLNSNVAFRVLP